ncbi:hypothetical protein [Pendulispora albinea]|uniref:Uncharacterized protein n=1 Tax=Pendulispora albinea TaxID=2741071 RepID=A0ABZ2M6V2_9BACT
MTTSPRCFGAGGDPGGSVFLKAGATALDPAALRTIVPVGDVPYYRFAPDKGNQGQGGADASIISNLASGRECRDNTPVLIRRQHTHPNPLRARDDGKLTVLVGTDSGFEALTVLVYDEIKVHLEPVP